MTNRQIKCPLCHNPMFPQHMSPMGSCYFCHDEARDSRRAIQKAALPVSEAREAKADALYKRSLSLAQRKKKKDADIEHQKRADEENKRLAAIHKEQASVALAKRSLLHYVERKVPGYMTSWHLEDICRHIERFVQDIADKKSPRLILQLPPRSGKSEIASDCLPAWALGLHPDWNIMITSYSDELPTKFSRSIREQLRSEDYRRIFPNGAKLNPEDSSAQAWSTTRGGGLRATGATGSILGFGAHLYVADDILKNQEVADSPGALDKLWDTITSTIYSRLAPGGGILMIGQRWSHDDPIGKAIANMEREKVQVRTMRQEAAEIADSDPVSAEKMLHEANELDSSMDKWTVVSYKALAEEDEYLTEEGEIVETSSSTIPSGWSLLRKKGEALHPERYSRYQYLKIKRAASQRRWNAMYMQTPVSDEGAYFTANDFVRYSPNKHPKLELMNVVNAWDLAVGVKQSNDWTVGVATGLDHEGNLWFLDQVRGKYADIREVSDLIIDLHLRWKASITGVERTHVEMVLGPILRDRMRERNQYITLAEGKEALKPITDKVARARTLQGLCRGRKVHIPEGDMWEEFINELTAFGATSHDDRVDAAAWAAIMQTRTPPPSDPKNAYRRERKESSWLDSIIDEATAKFGNYMGS